MKEGHRYEKCVDCGRTYNVSIFSRYPNGRYICPSCQYKRKPVKALIKANALGG